METLQYKSANYTTASSIPIFYIASTEFSVEFNFKYTTSVGSEKAFDKVSVDYNSLNAYGYTTLNSYIYDSDTGYITVDFTIVVNRMTAGALLSEVQVLGTTVVKLYLNDTIVSTIASTLNPVFDILDKNSSSIISKASINIPNLTPGYNDYSIEQEIELDNIKTDSLTYQLDFIGNVDNVSSSISDSKFNLKWVEYYFPIKYKNSQSTSDSIPELNCQFVLTVEGINSKNGRRVTTTALIDKTYNTILDNIGVQTSQNIGWQSPKYDIVVDRIDNYSATISSTRFIDNKEHSWYLDKQIFNTDLTQYTVTIYSSEIKKSDSGYYRLYFSDGKKVDVLLTKNGYPECYTPTTRCNFTLPVEIDEEEEYSIKKSNDIRNITENILSGILYPMDGTAYLQLGDILKYYTDDIEISNEPNNITTDTKHNFSWASKSIYKNPIFNVNISNKDYYISPYIDYNNNTPNDTNPVNLVSFYSKIYKDIPFYISINLDYTTELNLAASSLSVFEYNTSTNKWDSIWSKENYEVYNGVVHQWFKYNGNSNKVKVELTLGNSVQYREFEVVNNLCSNDSFGYVYYINNKGGVDLVGINCSTLETVTANISTSTVKKRSGLKTDLVTEQYNKEIGRKWSAKTDLLTDKESKELVDLFCSNTVGLYLNDNWYDVNITDTEYKIKTLRNNSYKKFNLSFTLEENITYNKIK
jgi:hypothetical protein